MTINRGSDGSAQPKSTQSTITRRYSHGAPKAKQRVILADIAARRREHRRNRVLHPQNIEGTNVTLSADKQSVTVGDTTYSIATTGSSDYTLTLDADAMSQSAAINETPVTYTFSAAGTEYVTAIKDGKVYSYSTEGYGDEVSDITVTGDVTYSFTYANGSATGNGAINGQTTFTTTVNLSATEVSYIFVNGQQIELDSFSDSGTYTTQYGGTRYVYTLDPDSGRVTLATSSEAAIYTIEGDDEGEVTTLQINGQVVDADTIYTATYTADGNTYTTVGNAEAILTAIGDLSNADDFSLNLSTTETVNVNITGTASSSFISAEGSQATAAIIDGRATLDGVTLTFNSDGTGTYTTASTSDGRTATITNGSFTLEGSDDAVLATKDADGTWQIANGIDNITNDSDEPLSFKTPDGDEGTLAPGASYTPESNTLTNPGEGSLVKDNEGNYHTSDGDITGLPEDGSVAYDSAGNLQVSGANDDTKLNGNDLPVSGDDNFDATIKDGTVTAVDGVSDGATVSGTGLDVGLEPEASALFTGSGTNTINGEEVGVTGDQDGYQVTAAPEGEDGIAAIAGVSDGASVTAPEGTTVGTDTDGSVGEVNINGTKFNTTDPDGLIFIPTDDGFEVQGLNGADGEPAFLAADTQTPVTVGGVATNIGPNASLRADASGNVGRYSASDQALDQDAADRGIDIGALDAVDVANTGKTTTASGEEVIDLSANSEPALVRLNEDYDGTEILLPTIGGNYMQVDEDYEGEVNVTGSDGGDSFVNLSPNATMNATGGSGNDYFKTSNPNDRINLSNGGKDTLDVLTNGAILEDYDPTDVDAPAILTNAANQGALVDAVASGNLDFSDGGVENVQILGSDEENPDRTLARFMSEDGQSALYGWTGDDGGSLTKNGLSEGAVLVGNSKSDGNKGATEINADDDYADTIIAGAGDVISAGNGDDVNLVDNGSDSRDGAALNAPASTGRKNVTVKNFHGGFDRKAHSFRNAAFSGFSFLNGVLNFIAGAATYALNGWSNSAAYIEKLDGESDVTTTATQTADPSNPGSGVLEYKVTTDDTTTNNVAIANGKEYVVSDGSLELNFVGEGTSSSLAPTNNTTVNFNNITDNVVVDLSGNVTQDSYNFTNIQNIKGGAGESSLIGSDSGRNGFYAGSGNTSIYSGAGADTLYGYDGTEESKESTFFYTAGSGNDIIKGFDFGAGENNDKLNFSNTSLEAAGFDGSDLKITLEGGEEVLTIENGKNSIIKGYAGATSFDGAVEFGDNLTYDEDVVMYGNAYEDGNKLTINDSNAGGNVAIYQNGKDEYGQAFDGKYYYGVNDVDASALTYDASLAGSDGENDTIRGGAGNNSLWGGLGGNDTLVGGTGTNTFFYLGGDGEDVITNAKSGDTIELWNISVDDIDLAGTYENSSTAGIEVKFNDGGSLKVNGSGLGNVGFKVGDDVWKINSDKTWRNRGEDESNS